MKTTVMAENEEKAKELVKSKIVFHKVEKSKDEFNQAIDMMDDMLNILGGKRSVRKVATNGRRLGAGQNRQADTFAKSQTIKAHTMLKLMTQTLPCAKPWLSAGFIFITNF